MPQQGGAVKAKSGVYARQEKTRRSGFHGRIGGRSDFRPAIDARLPDVVAGAIGLRDLPRKAVVRAGIRLSGEWVQQFVGVEGIEWLYPRENLSWNFGAADQCGNDSRIRIRRRVVGLDHPPEHVLVVPVEAGRHRAGQW